MPSNFDVQIITLLSADPEAKRLPKSIFKKKILTFVLNQHFPEFLSVLGSDTLESGSSGSNPGLSGIE